MSNVSRAYPGALASARGDSFLTTFNADRAAIYAHTDALQTQHERFSAGVVGKGTLPGNTAELYVDNPTAGRVYCPVGYKAVVGATVETTAIISQAYTASVLNHVFLVVSTAGALSLRVSEATTEGANELWIADVDDTGTIVNEPSGKVYAGIGMGDASDGSLAGLISGRYVEYVSNATPDTEDTVAHGLGRAPVGYLVVGRDKAGIIYDGTTAWDATSIYLKCNVASTTAMLLVF